MRPWRRGRRRPVHCRLHGSGPGRHADSYGPAQRPCPVTRGASVSGPAQDSPRPGLPDADRQGPARPGRARASRTGSSAAAWRAAASDQRTRSRAGPSIPMDRDGAHARAGRPRPGRRAARQRSPIPRPVDTRARPGSARPRLARPVIAAADRSGAVPDRLIRLPDHSSHAEAVVDARKGGVERCGPSSPKLGARHSDSHGEQLQCGSDGMHLRSVMRSIPQPTTAAMQSEHVPGFRVTNVWYIVHNV